jgi:hypothetical protein
MSETNVQTVDPNALVDLFPDLGAAPVKDNGIKPSFGMSEGIADLFNTAPPQTQTPVQPPAQTQTPPAKTAEELEAEKDMNAPPAKEDPTKEVDILGTGVPATEKPAGSPISDLSTYYQDRIKSGKFVAIEDTDKDGKPIPFIPKTAEEYDEVLELQINYRLDEAKKEIEQKWFTSKSPAWQTVSKYAELLDDPTQMIPFLQGVKTFTSVANMDENDAEGAERIVRTRLAQKGDTEEIIAQQVDALKTTDKLIATAKLYKPVILQQEQAQLQAELRSKQEQERQYMQLVTDIRDNALKSIEAPVFGKTKLKNEEKAAIYDLIAEPAEDTQGYGIYNVIDSLFDKREFEKLKEVALLLSNRDAFMNYLGISVANATAAGLERKLRLAGEARKASGNDFHEENEQARVQRNQFKSKPNFGRGN